MKIKSSQYDLSQEPLIKNNKLFSYNSIQNEIIYEIGITKKKMNPILKPFQ
jgi:hypothetical protein